MIIVFLTFYWSLKRDETHFGCFTRYPRKLKKECAKAHSSAERGRLRLFPLRASVHPRGAFFCLAVHRLRDKKNVPGYPAWDADILSTQYHSNWPTVHFACTCYTLLIDNGFGSRRRLLSWNIISDRPRKSIPSAASYEDHTILRSLSGHHSFHSQWPNVTSGLLLFLIGLTKLYFSTVL